MCGGEYVCVDWGCVWGGVDVDMCVCVGVIWGGGGEGVL